MINFTENVSSAFTYSMVTLFVSMHLGELGPGPVIDIFTAIECSEGKGHNCHSDSWKMNY